MIVRKYYEIVPLGTMHQILLVMGVLTGLDGGKVRILHFDVLGTRNDGKIYDGYISASLARDTNIIELENMQVVDFCHHSLSYKVEFK